MLSFKFLSTKDKWLLAIIDSTPYVDGRTRLHKYGILASKEVLNNTEFFDDWKPNDFGGFSPSLAKSLQKLERGGYVQSLEVVREFGEVDRYQSLEKGKNVIKDLIKNSQTKFEKIKSITSHYFQKPLKILLSDVYQKYPELTVKSKIKAEINKINDIFSPQPESLVTPTVPSREHVFNDDEFRKKLAESIGLEQVPSLDPKSFDRIKGILAKKIETEDFDSVDLVKEIRGC